MRTRREAEELVNELIQQKFLVHQIFVYEAKKVERRYFSAGPH